MRRIIALVVLSLSAGSYGQQQPSPQVEHRRLPIECDHAAPPRGTHWVCDDANNPCNCRLESDPGGKQPFDDDDGLPVKKSTPTPTSTRISADDFYKIMNTVAESRSEGDGAQAAEMFAEDAVYSNPAGGELRKGRAAIYKLFGGAKGSEKPRKMQWHHLLFNEQDQVGAGEFTLEGYRHLHGMVMVKVANGKISNWREYRVASNQSWDKFTGENQF
jgi:SnoaL-like domain